MEAAHSEAGVFYQAVPAVGPDGKNVLKLIPVKMINGNFFHEQMIKPRVEPTTQRVSSTPQQIKMAVTPSATEKTVPRKLTIVKGFPSQVGLVPGNLASKPPPQQQAVYSPGRLPHQLPVTVKSPGLPRGQMLQVPPNAPVEKRILKPSVKGSDEPSAIYASPVTTVIRDSAIHTLKPPLKLIPKASNRPNGPIRWVIEEEGGTGAQSLHPATSPLVPHVVNTVKKTEKAGRQQHGEVAHRAASESSAGQSRCDALVTCNGEVVFVAEKRSLPEAKGQSELERTVGSSAVQQTAQKMSVAGPDEVIDLCGNDAQDDSTSVFLHQEDDNVIFVSYIPPKAEAKSARRSGKTNASRSDGVKGLERRRGGGGGEGSALTGEGTRNVMNQHSASSLQPGTMRYEVQAGIPADPSSCDGSRATCSHTQDESSLSPEEREMADHRLRKTFGIRSGVKIHLLRIDEAPAPAGPVLLTEPAESEYAGSGSDHQNRTGEDQSADIAPLQHCPSAPSAVTEAGNAPVLDYVEPIDEDFLSSNEDAAEQRQTQNTKTGRIVRTRKRTMCPCCIPGSLGPEMKYVKAGDLDKMWTCGTEHTRRKKKQTKTDKNGFVTGRQVPSMHSELKRHKHVKRVK